MRTTKAPSHPLFTSRSTRPKTDNNRASSHHRTTTSSCTCLLAILGIAIAGAVGACTKSDPGQDPALGSEQDTASTAAGIGSTTDPNCDVLKVEQELTKALEQVSSSVPFSVVLERDDGRSFEYHRGGTSLTTAYESASTSKWVAATAILWVLSRVSDFTLEDTPSKHGAWTMPTDDPLYAARLRQLLSFTSGLSESPPCLKLGLPKKGFFECINDSTGSVVASNKGNTKKPGDSFEYSSSHLQVAGAMAIKAGGYPSWQALFEDFKRKKEIFVSSNFNLPTTGNPRLAGGMTWTTSDYIEFLRRLYRGSLIEEELSRPMFKDQVEGSVGYSPAVEGLNEDWHYGFGVWLECRSKTFNCTEIDYHSSPGAYGAYPFISLRHQYYGIVARQGELGTFTEGVALFRSIQALSEQWSACQPPETQ